MGFVRFGSHTRCSVVWVLFFFFIRLFYAALRLQREWEGSGGWGKTTWSYFFINTLQSFRILLPPQSPLDTIHRPSPGLHLPTSSDPHPLSTRLAAVITTFTLLDASAAEWLSCCSSFVFYLLLHIIYGATIYFYLAFHCCGSHLHALAAAPYPPRTQRPRNNLSALVSNTDAAACELFEELIGIASDLSESRRAKLHTSAGEREREEEDGEGGGGQKLQHLRRNLPSEVLSTCQLQSRQSELILS